LPSAWASKKPALVVDAGAAVGEFLAALGDLHVGETLWAALPIRMLTDCGGFTFLAEEELGVEAGFAGLGQADRLARDGDREQRRAASARRSGLPDR
jgi:hypothetical protein